jgi:CRP/FNR family cyclic AMP-dependent transcriptional regulator
MPTLTELIPGSRWVNALSPKERDKVDCDTMIRTVPKGGHVCHKGEPVQHWIGVLEGLVKIATMSAHGKLAAFAGIPAGGWFGEGSLLKDEPRQYEAVALRESLVAYVPRTLFLSLLSENTQFGRFLLVQLNERLGLAMSIIEHQRLLGPDGRVAQCLASLMNPTLYPGLGSTLRISQEEIGQLVGLSRQRVNQSLKLLQERKLLRTEHLGMTILDLQGLRRFDG